MKYIKYKKEKLRFILDNYACNGALYVSLLTQDNEYYTDLSINIPDYMLEFEEEIIINNDTSNDLVEKLVDMGILTDMYKVAHSGFATYRVMYFNKELAKDYIAYDYSFGGEE